MKKSTDPLAGIPNADPLLTPDQAAALLGVSPAIMRDKRSRPVAFVMVNKHVRFQRSDIDDYIRRNKVLPDCDQPVPTRARRRAS